MSLSHEVKSSIVSLIVAAVEEDGIVGVPAEVVTTKLIQIMDSIEEDADTILLSKHRSACGAKKPFAAKWWETPEVTEGTNNDNNAI